MLARALRYWAFICYSHQDKDWADWLYEELETFVIEARFRAELPEDAPCNDRLGPVYLDRMRVAAGADLEATIRAALRDSLFLIVLASPHAARSPRVAREIEIFCDERGLQHVVVLPIGGGSSDIQSARADHEEYLPEPLRRRAGESATAHVLSVESGGETRRRESALLHVAAHLIGGARSKLRLSRRPRQLATAGIVLAIAIGIGIGIGMDRHWPLSRSVSPDMPLTVMMEPLHFADRSPAHEFLAAMVDGAVIDGLARTGSLVTVSPDGPDRLQMTLLRLSGVLRDENDEVVLDLTIRDQRKPDSSKSTTLTFREPLAKVLDLEPEVPLAVLQQLGLKPAPVTSATAWRHKVAQEEYIEGRYLWLRNGPRDFDRAVRALKKSLSINSAFGQARTTLSEACTGRADPVCAAIQSAPETLSTDR